MKTEHNTTTTTDDGENRGGMDMSDSEDEAESEKYDEELHYISQRLDVIKHELIELQTRQVWFSWHFLTRFKQSSKGGIDQKEGATRGTAKENVEVGAQDQTHRQDHGLVWAGQQLQWQYPWVLTGF